MNMRLNKQVSPSWRLAARRLQRLQPLLEKVNATLAFHRCVVQVRMGCWDDWIEGTEKMMIGRTLGYSGCGLFTGDGGLKLGSSGRNGGL
jgi:hypothetical protein